MGYIGVSSPRQEKIGGLPKWGVEVRIDQGRNYYFACERDGGVIPLCLSINAGVFGPHSNPGENFVVQFGVQRLTDSHIINSPRSDTWFIHAGDASTVLNVELESTQGAFVNVTFINSAGQKGLAKLRIN